MAYPTDQNNLRALIEAAAGTNTETYTVPSTPFKHVLGSSLSPAMPAGWVVVPSGAAPITPPAAPTAGTPATTTAAGHFLAATGTYQWKLVSATQFGLTTPGAAFAPGALGAGVTGYNLAMPSITEGTADAPVLFRKLYRTTNGGATFYWVADIDNEITSYLDGKADADLDVAAPTVNTSGSTGAVSLTIGGTAGTEMSPGATLATKQYIVDHSQSGTGGTITHYSGDAGLSVTATYTAANLLNMITLNAVITAIKSIVTAFGTPGAASGTPQLNASTLVVQDPASKGLANGVARLDASTNLVVESGHKLTVAGQTGNTTTDNVANQAVGMFLIPSGTVSGSMITVNNTLVTAHSHIFVQVHYAGNFITSVWPNLQGIVAGTSFPVQVGCSATLTANVEVSYWIIN